MWEELSTRANELVDPGLHVWGWEIPVYLFLGGLVAGMMIVCGVLLRRGVLPRPAGVLKTFPIAALLLLSAGMLALFLDLEHKLHVLRLYLVFEPTSPMSWGAWILILVYPVLVALALIEPPAAISTHLPPASRARAWLIARPKALRALATLAILIGTALGLYTGVLLSSLGARPFWSNGLLAPLFLASGLSSGTALAHAVSNLEREKREFLRADTMLLAAELAILLLFVLSLASAGEASREASALLLGGALSSIFWVVVVGLGVVSPLAIQLVVLFRHDQHVEIAPALVLLGGLALRMFFVWAGQVSHWPHG